MGGAAIFFECELEASLGEECRVRGGGLREVEEQELGVSTSIWEDESAEV